MSIQITITTAPGNLETRRELPVLDSSSVFVDSATVANSVNLSSTITDFLNDMTVGVNYSNQVASLINYGLWSNEAYFNVSEMSIKSKGGGPHLNERMAQEWFAFTGHMFDHFSNYESLTERFAYLPLMDDDGNIPAIGSPYLMIFDTHSGGRKLDRVRKDGVQSILHAYRQKVILGEEISQNSKAVLKDISAQLLAICCEPLSNRGAAGKTTIFVKLNNMFESVRVREMQIHQWHRISWALFLLYLVDLIMSIANRQTGSDN